jgi:hypothetical protein
MKSNLDDLMIDEAIESYPLESLPPDFLAGVLEKIEVHPRVDPKLVGDANTRFIFRFIPVAILWLGFTGAALAAFSPAWINPARASYYRLLAEYWKMQIIYSSGDLSKFGFVALVLAVVGGFALVWQLTNPAREFDV